MATYSKVFLSGSTNGRPIKVTATASSGTTIHATGTSSTVVDEVWLYAINTSTSDVLVTAEFGGTTSPDDRITLTVPGQTGPFVLSPGFILSGTGSAANTVRVFAATANVINIIGYVNRIS